MKQTLGGQRLGSGNKMEVELHGFERSTHDMSYIWRSTMSAGTLVPFLKEVALPGDTFDIHLNADIKTHPTIGPLFGSYKVQLDIFLVPMRLYHSALHNNKLGIGMNMAQVRLPKYTTGAIPMESTNPDPDNSQINPSCILSYLGHRGVGTIPDVAEGTSESYRNFNAIPLLAYWEIYKNYYANKQEEIGAVIAKAGVEIFAPTAVTVDGNAIPDISISAPTTVIIDSEVQIVVNSPAVGTPTDPDLLLFYFWGEEDNPVTLRNIVKGELEFSSTGVWSGVFDFWRWGAKSFKGQRMQGQAELLYTPPEVYTFPLENIDTMREQILASPPLSEFNVTTADIEPYSLVFRESVWTDGAFKVYARQSTQEGLALKTYQSDLFNNWLSTEWIDGTGGINEITAVDTSSGSFNIDALQLAKKVYDMLNRIAVSGGSYNDWLEAVYDHPQSMRAESPMYLGGLIKELVFQEVVSNSSSNEGGQPLGTLAGKGVMGQKHKGGNVTVRVDEPSYIMGIISLTPRIDYSQGNKWDIHLDTLDDLHKPNLDQIGFQELITEQMAWWTTNYPGTGTFEQKSAGKQPAWINYMTNVNEVRGNFAISSNEMFMTLNRRYTPVKSAGATGNWNIQDLTTYIDPSKFNHIFAQTNLDAQNFWAQISVDMTARRKMSAKIMPNL